LFGTDPPSLSRDLLSRAIAFRLQERAFGGLSRASLHRLDEISNRTDGAAPPPEPASLRPGGRLVRESETPPGQLALTRLLARAHRIRRRLFEDHSTIEEAAALESVTASYVTRVVGLAFLAPDIVASMLAGRHAHDMSATRLMADTRLPLDWKAQGEALAKADL
jgi:hypothetical protein